MRNIISACIKALNQIAKDLKIFIELAEYFLSEEDFKLLDLSFNVSITSLENITKEEVCDKCRDFIYEEKAKDKVYSKEQIFGVHDLTSPSETTLKIFKILATLYIGGASIIENECYHKESKQMNMIEDGMKNVLAKEEKGGNEKYIAHNKLIMLGPDQNNIFMSGIGLHNSYTVVAPWGGGKSVLLKLELSRIVELHNNYTEKVKIFLVVYENKATELLEKYEVVANDLKKKGHIENLRDICKLFSLDRNR